MLDEALNKCADNNNYTIYTSMCKAQRILMRSYDAVCSISGGSDSDIVLDLIHKVDEDGKVKYFWIDLHNHRRNPEEATGREQAGSRQTERKAH